VDLGFARRDADTEDLPFSLGADAEGDEHGRAGGGE
jgi:hypothetical protein